MESRDRGRTAERPGSVTLAAVLLIGGEILTGGVLGLIVALGGAAPEIGVQVLTPAQQAIGTLGVLVRLIAGIGVLRRWGWTRWPFAACAIPVVGYGLAVNPLDPQTIFATAVTWLTVALLVTPVANAWFRGSPEPAELTDVFR
ncbi:MAG TPA: hypothetical protein VGC56_12460 [Allosphingosinicella sp.]|jgi:hypothetical protein